MGQVFDPPTRLRGLATRAVALGRRTDVYVGCAPRTRRHGGRDAVKRAFVLWVDCDGEHAVAALEDFEPAPSIVIASGTGSNCHAYWPLIEALAAEEIERANRRLAHALGADPASADAARILRVPGTLSWKHEPPTAVEALRLDTRQRFERGDVVGSLPDPPSPARATVVPAEHRGDDPLLAIAPDIYVRRLLRVEVPRHRKVPCPFHEDRHASLHVYETAERGWYCFGALPARGHDLRPRRTPVRLHRPRRGLPQAARRTAPPVRDSRRRDGCGRPRTTSPTSQTDIPEGMTIREWRAQRAAESAARAGRPSRRRRLRPRVVAVAAYLRAAGRGLVRRIEVRHSSGAPGSMWP